MKIESTKVDVNTSPEVIYSFLNDSTNLVHLLPQENISDWRATSTECSFKAQGGVTISLIQDGGNPPHQIFMKSGEKSPFPFRLTIFINESNGASNGYIEFDGEVNMFLKMMVEKPLTKLFNHMAKKLQTQFS